MRRWAAAGAVTAVAVALAADAVAPSSLPPHVTRQHPCSDLRALPTRPSHGPLYHRHGPPGLSDIYSFSGRFDYHLCALTLDPVPIVPPVKPWRHRRRPACTSCWSSWTSLRSRQTSRRASTTSRTSSNFSQQLGIRSLEVGVLIAPLNYEPCLTTLAQTRRQHH